MRFVFISTMDAWPWGGSEELWTRAAAELRRRGHDVRASVPYWPRLSKKFTDLRSQGVDINTHVSRNAGKGLRLWNKLSRAGVHSQHQLKRYQPDLVIISQGYNSGGFPWAQCCLRAGLPYVMIVHCNSEHWWFGERINEALEAYRGALKVYGVSRQNLDLLKFQLGDPLTNLEVVRNPWNVQNGRISGWPDDVKGWRLASVARLDIAAKGQDLLLQIMAQSEWRNRPVHLSLFGSGGDEETLRRIAEMLHLQNVCFRGPVEDVSTIWADHHLLVLPSRYEGLPLVLVEAMWCQRPAVVTDVGGNTELCTENETGFVAPKATISDFSAALERAWSQRERWKSIGEAGHAAVKKLLPSDPVSAFCDKLENVSHS